MHSQWHRLSRIPVRRRHCTAHGSTSLRRRLTWTSIASVAARFSSSVLLAGAAEIDGAVNDITPRPMTAAMVNLRIISSTNDRMKSSKATAHDLRRAAILLVGMNGVKLAATEGA